MQCELSSVTRHALQSLAYSAWIEAYDNLKRTKAEETDGSTDWLDFHTVRLNSAALDEAHFREVHEEIAKYSPMILGK